MGLAGEDDLERPIRVVDQLGQAVDVREDHAAPLVGREPPGEADREGIGVQHVLELIEGSWRLAMAGELDAETATREVGQLALLAEVGGP